MPLDAREILTRHAAAVDAAIARWALASTTQTAAPERLVESMAYSLKAGGKRLRPALVLEAFTACSGRQTPATKTEFPPDLTSESPELAAALAIEMVHTFSLIHDDLPAMDNDDLRRGLPTNHKVFGEAMAILAGDGLLAEAFIVLAQIEPPQLARGLIRELASATGPAGMVGGQVLDMQAENQPIDPPSLERIHRLKTGALLTASVRMGALAANVDAPRLEAITRFGRHVGLAFQIADDILDVTSTAETLGKAANKDHGAGKNTYPRLHGLEASRHRARAELDQGIQSITTFGPEADGLRSLARFAVDRDR